MVKNIDYEFIRGDTKKLNKFRPTDLNGEVLSLSNSDNIYFTMKDANGTAQVKKYINNGITLGEDGYYHITLEADDTEDLEIGTYNYDIELVLNITPKEFVATLITGEITLTQDITTKGDRT